MVPMATNYKNLNIDIIKPDSYGRIGLFVVDVQNDFISGSLATNRFINGEDGIEVVPVINRLMDIIKFDLVVFSRDWHPPDHCSFLSSPVTSDNGNDPSKRYGKFPKHCVIDTWGAEYHRHLNLNPEAGHIVHVLKGTKLKQDAFSALEGYVQFNRGNPKTTNSNYNRNNNNSQAIQLIDTIREYSLDSVFVCGLATEYCVLETCLQLKRLFTRTYLFIDACRGTKPFHDTCQLFKHHNIRCTTTDIVIKDMLANYVQLSHKINLKERVDNSCIENLIH